ncbi:MAG: hypothetical protein OEW45_21815, partial [Deltaproteobacteria bacterium]|nr:hypothetical protein [Deltaproteobacteria bacterium]
MSRQVRMARYIIGASFEALKKEITMDEVKRIRTACRNCHGGCGVVAHVKDGKVIKVEGDPASPISHGTM